jgi:hypothetical protein
VDISTRYELDNRGVGVRVPVGARFLLHHSVQTSSAATQPPLQWPSGALSPDVKRPGREADHSPPASAEFKICRSIYEYELPYTPSLRSA